MRESVYITNKLVPVINYHIYVKILKKTHIIVMVYE